MVVGLLAIPAGFGALYAVRISVDEAAAVAADGGADERGGEEGEPGSEEDEREGEEDDLADGDRTESVASIADFLTTSRTLFASAFVFVFAILIISGLYYRGVTTFLQQILSELPFLSTVTLGQVDLEPSRFVYAGLLMIGMAGQYVGGKLTDRIPTEWGLAGGFGALALVGLLFVPASNAGIVPLLVVSALLGFFMFTVQPLYQATVAEYSPPETRGLTYGYTYLGVFGVGAIGAFIAGAALTYYSQSGLFIIFAGLATLASLIGLGLSVRGRN